MARAKRERTDGARTVAVERVDERLVDQAVSHLRRLVVAGQVETVVAVGEYLIENFYGGVDSARSRSPVKAASLARLADRAGEFGMTPATLGYVVPVTLAVKEMGVPLAGRLGITRVRALLPLKDTDQRKLLAETAAASSWTVNRVRARVRQIAKPHAGGRPELPAVTRLLGRMVRLLDEESAPAKLRDGLDSIAPVDARRLLQQVNRAQGDLERIEKLLIRAATRQATNG